MGIETFFQKKILDPVLRSRLGSQARPKVGLLNLELDWKSFFLSKILVRGDGVVNLNNGGDGECNFNIGGLDYLHPV